MADIKETIQGLYSLKTYLASKAIEEAIEGNGPARESLIGMQKVVDSAVNMLKEQEAVLLKDQHKNGGHIINANSPWKSRCPRCGKKIEGRQTRFCKYCGQGVRWE